MNKQVSIGLGCVTFGREIDQDAAFAMMDHALSKGIRMFDTAAAYGKGASETIIGSWLAKRQPSESVIIATKILPPFEPENIQASVDESLKRLGVDAIDILYLHRWDESCETLGCLSTLGDLIRSGRVRTLGVSNFSAMLLKRLIHLQSAHQFYPIRFVQNNHNLAVSDIGDELRSICMQNAIEIITYSPLAAGFLTGKHERKIEAGSRFDLMPAHRDVYFNEASFRKLKKLQSIASRTGYTPAHLALAWALHQNVSTVLIGGRTPGHLDQAFEALSFNEPELFAELEED